MDILFILFYSNLFYSIVNTNYDVSFACLFSSSLKLMVFFSNHQGNACLFCYILSGMSGEMYIFRGEVISSPSVRFSGWMRNSYEDAPSRGKPFLFNLIEPASSRNMSYFLLFYVSNDVIATAL